MTRCAICSLAIVGLFAPLAWAQVSVDPVSQVQDWVRSYTPLRGVAVGWAEMHDRFVEDPDGSRRELEDELWYEESLLAGDAGFLISNWRFPWDGGDKGLETAQIALGLASNESGAGGPSQISQPGGESLVNTTPRTSTFQNTGLVERQDPSGIGLARSDLVLARWLADRPERLAESGAVRSEDGMIVLTPPGTNSRIFLGPVLGGMAIHRVDQLSSTGGEAMSFRMSDFRRVPGLPQPVAFAREMWMPKLTREAILSGTEPSGPLLLQRTGYLAFAKPLDDVSPEVFRPRLDGLREIPIVAGPPLTPPVVVPVANSTGPSDQGSIPASSSVSWPWLVSGVGLVGLGVVAMVLRARGSK
jgi:hypothetical protein